MAVTPFAAKRGLNLAWLFVALLAVCNLGCAGDATEIGAAGNVIAQFQAELPALPQEGLNAKRLAALQSELQLGDAALAKSAGAQVSPPQMILPASVAELQWAYYGFHVGTGILTDVQVHFSMDTGTQAWIGLSNYGKNRWDISGPFSTTEDVLLNTGENYISPGGDFYVLVATYNLNTARIQELFLTYNDGVDMYHIAGTVLDDSASPIDGASVTIQPGDHIAMCNASGGFSVSGLTSGAYDVTPNASGYTFNPSTQSVPLLNADVDNVDFVGTLTGTTYSINGQLLDGSAAVIPASSVTVDPGGLSFNCDGTGAYHATGLVPGTYKVTPVAVGFTFVPAFSNIDVSVADVNNINFTGTGAVVVTYVDDARPFLMANCAGCHKADKPLLAGYTVEWYDSVLTKLPQIKSQVQGDHQGSYSAQEKAMIAAWVDAGGPLGASATHYTEVRAQIFQPICMNCHSSTKTGAERNGAAVDVNWDTYAGATAYRANDKFVAKRGNTRVQAGTMPPTGELSPALKALWQKWTDSGWPN